jgi:hypothetical protein
MRNNKLTSNLSPICKSVWCCCAMRSFGRGQVRSCIRAIVVAAGSLMQYLPAPNTNSPCSMCLMGQRRWHPMWRMQRLWQKDWWVNMA